MTKNIFNIAAVHIFPKKNSVREKKGHCKRSREIIQHFSIKDKVSVKQSSLWPHLAQTCHGKQQTVVQLILCFSLLSNLWRPASLILPHHELILTLKSSWFLLQSISCSRSLRPLAFPARIHLLSHTHTQNHTSSGGDLNARHHHLLLIKAGDSVYNFSQRIKWKYPSGREKKNLYHINFNNSLTLGDVLACRAYVCLAELSSASESLSLSGSHFQTKWNKTILVHKCRKSV